MLNQNQDGSAGPAITVKLDSDRVGKDASKDKDKDKANGIEECNKKFMEDITGRPLGEYLHAFGKRGKCMTEQDSFEKVMKALISGNLDTAIRTYISENGWFPILFLNAVDMALGLIMGLVPPLTFIRPFVTVTIRTIIGFIEFNGGSLAPNVGLLKDEFYKNFRCETKYLKSLVDRIVNSGGQGTFRDYTDLVNIIEKVRNIGNGENEYKSLNGKEIIEDLKRAIDKLREAAEVAEAAGVVGGGRNKTRRSKLRRSKLRRSKLGTRKSRKRKRKRKSKRRVRSR